MSDDSVSKLERLARLRETGAISEAEFASEKAKILAAPAPSGNRLWLYGSLAAGLAIIALVALVMLLNPPHANIVPGTSPKPRAPIDTNSSDAAELPDAPVAPLPVGPSDLPAAFAAARLPSYVEGGDEDAVAFAPERLLPLGDLYVLVSVGRGPQVHATGGAIAVSYLSRTANGFQPAAAPVIATTGSFGAIGGWTLRRDLGPSPVILLSGGGTWQGCTVSSASLIELRADRPVQLEGQIVTEMDDQSDAGEGQRITATLSRSEDGIRASYSGDIDRSVDYRREGDRLQPDSEPVDGC